MVRDDTAPMSTVDVEANCLFCRIRDGSVPAKMAYRDPVCIGFYDINPQAPLHVLIVPRKHIPTLNLLTDDDKETIGHLHQVAAKLAQENGYADVGYRTVFNCNRGAGQTVFHIHLHLLAGRALGWPPG
jgi:histidine triad (HIT) family protein